MSAERRLLPMEADKQHALSLGALETPGSTHSGDPAALTSASAPTFPAYFSAWHLSGNRYVVAATPFLGEFEAEFPTQEAAEAHALALNEWLASRPSADLVQPFFVVPRQEPTYEGLLGIFQRMLDPETP